MLCIDIISFTCVIKHCSIFQIRSHEIFMQFFVLVFFCILLLAKCESLNVRFMSQLFATSMRMNETYLSIKNIEKYFSLLHIFRLQKMLNIRDIS